MSSRLGFVIPNLFRDLTRNVETARFEVHLSGATSYYFTYTLANMYNSVLAETTAVNPQKLAKWRRWLGDPKTHGTIIRELVDLAVIREVYSGVREMVQKNPALQQHSAFHSVFALNYAHSVLMYVRRQVRYHRKSIGLIMLAYDLRNNSNLITENFYIELYTRNALNEDDRNERERWGRSVFQEKFAGAVGIHLDPAVIEADIAELKAIADASSSFTDRRIAHLDKREPSNIPTHDELDG